VLQALQALDLCVRVEGQVKEVSAASAAMLDLKAELWALQRRMADLQGSSTTTGALTEGVLAKTKKPIKILAGGGELGLGCDAASLMPTHCLAATPCPSRA
jgi:hypothetical protein